MRRLDLDADARLSKKEFFDGITPQENYTKSSLATFKKATKRPKSSSFARTNRIAVTHKPIDPMGNLLHGKSSNQERTFMRQQHVYHEKYIEASQLQSAHQFRTHCDETPAALKEPAACEDSEASLDYLNRVCFREIVNIERELDTDKCILAQREDFGIESAFLCFAKSTLDRLNVDTFEEGLNNLGVEACRADVRLLINRYDADGDGKLSYWEFANIFLPVDDKMRAALEARKVGEQKMVNDARHLVKRLLSRVLNAEAMVEAIRLAVKQSGHSLRGLFDSLDWLSRGYLTSSEIRRYFDNYPSETEMYRKGNVTMTDLEGLIRRFNKDKLNGRISLPEFLEELTAKNEAA